MAVVGHGLQPEWSAVKNELASVRGIAAAHDIVSPAGKCGRREGCAVGSGHVRLDSLQAQQPVVGFGECSDINVIPPQERWAAGKSRESKMRIRSG